MQHYMLVGRDLDTVQESLTILTQQCMDGLGFKVKIPQDPPVTGPRVDISYRRYGSPETLEDALEVGFGIPKSASPDPALWTAAHEFGGSLTAAEAQALGGTEEHIRKTGGPGGCMGAARARLVGDGTLLVAAGLAETPMVLDVNSSPQATDSEGTRKAQADFAECMAKAGYPDVTDPLERPKQFLQDDLQNPSEAEKQAAVAQFHCMESSGVRREMRAAEIAFQNRAIEANPEAFAQIRKELDDVVRRATEIVAEG